MRSPELRSEIRGAASQDAAPFPRLVGDVGGTQARFGFVPHAGAAVERVAELACADHAGLEAAIASYRGAHHVPPVAAAAIAVAATVASDLVSMTNLGWSFSIEGLRRSLGVDRLVVLNDFAALALSLPVLASDELRAIGGGTAVAGEPIALLGPGTGLGVAGLLRQGGARLPVASEGGHATLAADDDDEERLVAYLRSEFGHAAAERALSGNGIVNLYRYICAGQGRVASELSPSDVTAAALAGSDAASVQAVELFFALLGGFAGNLALTFGARGGVYIGGGIVRRLGCWIDRSRFRSRFEAKGRFASYLSAIPVWLIEPSSPPALRGANAALDGPRPSL
jgi:glucokinase